MNTPEATYSYKNRCRHLNLDMGKNKSKLCQSQHLVLIHGLYVSQSTARRISLCSGTKLQKKHFSANGSVSLQYKLLVAVTLPSKPINCYIVFCKPTKADAETQPETRLHCAGINDLPTCGKLFCECAMHSSKTFIELSLQAAKPRHATVVVAICSSILATSVGGELMVYYFVMICETTSKPAYLHDRHS